MKLSTKISGIAESGTVKLTPLIRRLKQEGKDVISFAVGEPDFDAPKEIIEATKKALENGQTKYSAVAGIPELREKICEKLKKQNMV